MEKDRKAEEKRWEKRWEREESKKGGYGLEIAVCTQGMHELVKKMMLSSHFFILLCINGLLPRHQQCHLLLRHA